jgi:hypothetical protein
MCSAYRSRFFLLLLSLFASSLLILIVIADGRGTRDKGGFGNFEMLKPRGTDCTTAQKTYRGVPEHLRSSSSSKVDAHTTLRSGFSYSTSLSRAPCATAMATASNRRAPRTPAFNNASEPPHIPHTIVCSSARTHPNRPRSWADSTGDQRERAFNVPQADQRMDRTRHRPQAHNGAHASKCEHPTKCSAHDRELLSEKSSEQPSIVAWLHRTGAQERRRHWILAR